MNTKSIYSIGLITLSMGLTACGNQCDSTLIISTGTGLATASNGELGYEVPLKLSEEITCWERNGDDFGDSNSRMTQLDGSRSDIYTWSMLPKDCGELDTTMNPVIFKATKAGDCTIIVKNQDAQGELRMTISLPAH